MLELYAFSHSVMANISKGYNNDLTPQLRVNAERAASYAQQARSENTKKSYQSDWAHFTAWCTDHDLVSMPATMQTVILYITEFADTFKISTLERRLASISQAHKTSGHDSPALVSREPLHSVWSGIVRSKSARRDKVAPVLTEDIKLMVSHLELDAVSGELTIRSIRDRAILLVGYAGALRRSEIANLIASDLQYTPEGLKILIRKSKTDQVGSGQVLGLTYGAHPSTCPVRAIRSWTKVAQIFEGPVFRAIDRHGNIKDKAITGHSIALIIKKACLRAGLPPEIYSGHSLRAGFATQAAKAGKPERIIMKHTRHKSEKMVREYIRDGELFNDSPTDALGL
ncbi:MAG: site-specific integrase [Rhodothermaceae bacterium]|nr:site-specific integrase [Rhodothermaceae bacterium]